MKLSEAIRLGAAISPQGNGYLFRPSDGSSCALGSAGLAAGVSKEDLDRENYGVLEALFPVIKDIIDRPVWCSCADEFNISWPIALEWAITHANDDHKWTREQIADWVATFEPADESKSEAAFEVESCAVSA